MDREIILKYVELALTNLNCNNQIKYNVEGEISRLMRIYDEEQIKEKVEVISFNVN